MRSNSRQVERLFHQCSNSSGSCERVLIRPRRYDDYLQQRMDRREPLEGFPATFYRHVEIEQSNVEAAFAEVLYGFATVFRNDNVVIFRSERRTQRGEHFFVIIGEQHFCFHVCQLVSATECRRRAKAREAEAHCSSARDPCRNQVPVLTCCR